MGHVKNSLGGCRRTAALAVGGLAVVLVTGCASGPPATPAPVDVDAGVVSGLVLPTPEHVEVARRAGDDPIADRSDWVHSRNDARLGAWPERPVVRSEAAEIQLNDRQWISNGRPRDYTRQWTRSRTTILRP